MSEIAVYLRPCYCSEVCSILHGNKLAINEFLFESQVVCASLVNSRELKWSSLDSIPL